MTEEREVELNEEEWKELLKKLDDAILDPTLKKFYNEPFTNLIDTTKTSGDTEVSYSPTESGRDAIENYPASQNEIFRKNFGKVVRRELKKIMEEEKSKNE